MSIENILIPKSIQEIRELVPKRYSLAKIGEDILDLNTAEQYKTLYNSSQRRSSLDRVFNKITSSFRDRDNIALENEISFGEFHYRDFIVLNDLLTPIQKWDITLCLSIFNGEEQLFNMQVVNTTKKELYQLMSKDFIYKNRLLHLYNHLQLIKLHLDFQKLGGTHETPSRFTELVQRAGWDNGIKMIKALLRVIKRLQQDKIIDREELQTRLFDRIQSDDFDITYKFEPGNQGHQIYVRHIFIEDITSVRVFKDDVEICNEEILEWDQMSD